MIYFKNAKQADWYKKPEMLGHRWAKEKLDETESMLKKYVKTKLQKRIASVAFKYDANEWQYFQNNISKGYISLVRQSLRKVKKGEQSYTSILREITNKGGMMKDRLNWVLELLAYENDKDDYFEWYASCRKFYGMDRDEAKERFEEYHKRLMGKEL